MRNTIGSSDPVRLTVSTRSPLVDPMQEITLRAALSRAIGLVADCFDNCNREAEPGSAYSDQTEMYEGSYSQVDDHKTTLVHTENLAKHLVQGGIDYLKASTDATLDAGSVARWASQSLTRSLVEASADCLWLSDPALDLDERLRRTNQMFVRACHEMLRVLPDVQETKSRFLSVDPAVKAACLMARDSALNWARAQGWTCANGKTITRGCWIGEIPGHREMVALVAKDEPGYWRDVCSMLSGATHSQPLLLTLSLKDEPDAHLDRALMVLNMGISFYADALRQFAEFMGWHDHDIDNWFAPVHLAIQHIRSPEEIPLPKFELEQCDLCPEYQEPHMHRLAFVSHLCTLLEHNLDAESLGGTDAPARYSAAVEFFDRFRERLMRQEDVSPETQKMRAALGVGHSGVLTLFGSDLREVATSIAASWAVLRSADYDADIGTLQCWVSRPED